MLIRVERESVPDLYTSCKHPQTEVRKMPIANGGFQLKKQCLVCGDSVGNAQKKAHLSADNVAKVPEWDQTIHPQFRDQREKRQQELIRAADERANKKWRAQYDAYLRSPEWAQRRQLVVLRAQGLCEGCRSARATDVHHTTYIHAGEEFLFELVALCTTCHSSTTKPLSYGMRSLLSSRQRPNLSLTAVPVADSFR